MVTVPRSIFCTCLRLVGWSRIRQHIEGAGPRLPNVCSSYIVGRVPCPSPLNMIAFELFLRQQPKLRLRNPVKQSTGRIFCVAIPSSLAQPNNSFKPSPLRGLVFAVSCTATLGRYAGRLNSGVSLQNKISAESHENLRICS